MNSFAQRLAAFFLAVLLLTYVGYQGYRYFSTQYETETAYSYTVADTLTARGIMIRDEEVIDEKPAGIVSYIYEDGTKVSAGMPIAEIYTNSADVKKQKKIRELEEEIALLQEAGTLSESSISGAEAINRSIHNSVTNLLTASDSGVVTDLDGSVNELTVLLNKKQVVTGKVDNFSERIAYLEKERDYQKSTISSGFTQFNSPQTGYFVHTLDGAEGLLSSENMESIPVEEYQKLVEREFTPDDSKIGKVIRSHNWYLAVPIEAKDFGRCRIGAKVDMDFHLTQLSGIPGVVKAILGGEDGQDAVLLIQCSYVLPELTSLRTVEVEIHFQSYTGLRISSDARRFLDGKEGVYVKQGHEIRFKTITPIYEEEGFILCGVSVDSENGLKLFDEVIVEGTELYDGKGIK